ncbi:MAG: hypothetical protein LUO93_06065, partial [Methanomicrobiales archaeon]|nr:hypothetical protein [Methanomicrobiales archaeon]
IFFPTMHLGRGRILILGTASLIAGIIIFGHGQPLFIYTLLLVPVWFFSEATFPSYTISFLLIYAGTAAILYTLLEPEKKHDWTDALQHAFLFGTLWMDHQIMYTDTMQWSLHQTHYAQYIIGLNGLMIILLAFLIPRLRGGTLSKQPVYWFYLCLGVLIALGSGYPIKL